MAAILKSYILQGLPGMKKSSDETVSMIDDDHDEATLVMHLPPDLDDLHFLIRESAQGCRLLLMLKRHLMESYGYKEPLVFFCVIDHPHLLTRHSPCNDKNIDRLFAGAHYSRDFFLCVVVFAAKHKTTENNAQEQQKCHTHLIEERSIFY